MQTRWQISRFAAVGLASNFILYGLYLLLTALGVEHKIAMTVLYVVGVSLTFLLNKSWTFKVREASPGVFIRYVSVYLGGYMINLCGLLLFVDYLQMPHQIIQAVMILVVAGYTFLCLKFWVFHHRTGKSDNVG